MLFFFLIYCIYVLFSSEYELTYQLEKDRVNESKHKNSGWLYLKGIFKNDILLGFSLLNRIFDKINELEIKNEWFGDLEKIQFKKANFFLKLIKQKKYFIYKKMIFIIINTVFDSFFFLSSELSF